MLIALKINANLMNMNLFLYMNILFRSESTQIQKTFGRLPDGRGFGRMGKRGEGIKMYKLVVTE